MSNQAACDSDRWTIEVDGMLQSLSRDGFDTASPLYLGYDLYVRTASSAEAPAERLRAAGYIVEFVGEDADYDRWAVIVSDPNAALITPELVAERWREMPPFAEAQGGVVVGLGVGIDVGYGEHQRPDRD